MNGHVYHVICVNDSIVVCGFVLSFIIHSSTTLPLVAMCNTLSIIPCVKLCALLFGWYAREIFPPLGPQWLLVVYMTCVVRVSMV